MNDQCCNRLLAERHATKAKAQGPDEKVVRLTEMGFDAQAAQAALFTANGDEQVIAHEGAETVATI